MTDPTIPLSRAEIEEFWDTWLAINREAERTGDWRVMADWYAEDASYGWMYSVDVRQYRRFINAQPHAQSGSHACLGQR